MGLRHTISTSACRRAVAPLTALAILAPVLHCTPARADFGLSRFDVTFTNRDGSPATQAGSHPYAMTTTVVLNTKVDSKQTVVPDGEIKDLVLGQVPGLVGDPTATPRCDTALFVSHEVFHPTLCPASSVIGSSHVTVGQGTPFDQPVYNLVPPPGVAAKIGFVVFTVPVTIDLTVSPKPPFNVIATLENISDVLPFESSVVTLWGDPADPAHDEERGVCQTGNDCPTNAPNVPFLTLPRACTGPLTTTFEADSWQNVGVFVHGSAETHDNSEPAEPLGMTGCSKLAFSPTIAAQPTSEAAGSPTGLDFALNVHDEGITNPTGLAQSDIKKTVVTLPEGMTANPSLAEGLTVCSEADLARETVNSAPGEGCPSESKVGTVEVETPLLEEPLKGSLFMAKPYANPFDSLLAMYFVIKNPKLGLDIVQPAEIVPNETTGRIVTVVENIPQLPFSHFKLHFREGARSPLITPPACGSYNATAELTPWSGGPPLTSSSTFQVISGEGAGPCPAGGVPPFAPQALAGTLNNRAGAYSSFFLRIERHDGEQEITKFTTNLPAGLTGNLSGIPFCPDAAIEAARRVTGAQESAAPSCPAASEIGHTLVGAGVGGVLAYTPGKVYLAGPYHGSALSVVSITSATVGPFDLGTVVIRFALRINPITAQVEIDSTGSDPIPHIIKGIVVHVREIHVYVDREKFILNPTNCGAMAISNTITGAGADFTNPADQNPVTVASRFQAANCANLNFKPSFKVSTNAKTSRKTGASLNVKLAYPKTPLGTQANIKSVKVDLPRRLPSRLTTLQQACTSRQFNANPAGCPAGSRVGQASAITPILPVPIVGPAYFVSYGGAKFPELVLVLQGYGITIDLHGETFISKAGITSSTFRTVPDQPVTSFELTLPQGPDSALAANGNLCRGKLRMPTLFTGQNGAVIKQTTPIAVVGCLKHKAKRARKAANGRGATSRSRKK